MAEEGLKVVRSIIELNGSIFSKAISLLQSLESFNDEYNKKITYIRQQKFNSYKNIDELLATLRQALEFVQQEKWVSAKDGEIPSNAVSFAEDIDGNQLYVARVQHENGLHPGKAGRHLDNAIISYGGKEVFKNEYEVLVIPSQFYEWYPYSSVQEIPRMAVKGGFESDGKVLYVSRAVPLGACSVQLGKVGTHFSRACIPFDRKEHTVSEFEIMAFSKGMDSKPY
jgi:hypothetical protein